MYSLHMERMDWASSCRQGDAEFIHTSAVGEITATLHICFPSRILNQKCRSSNLFITDAIITIELSVLS